MKGFVITGKAKDVFAALQALAKLEWEMLDLCHSMCGNYIRLD